MENTSNKLRKTAEGGLLITTLSVEETQADHVEDVYEPGRIQKF